ncbi:hypothetical protein ALC53_10037, partial [Atta colombica]
DGEQPPRASVNIVKELKGCGGRRKGEDENAAPRRVARALKERGGDARLEEERRRENELSVRQEERAEANGRGDTHTHDRAPRRRGQAVTATVRGTAESQPRGVNTDHRCGDDDDDDDDDDYDDDDDDVDDDDDDDDDDDRPTTKTKTAPAGGFSRSNR